MSSDPILTNLNASQRAAVASAAPTLAILAGPGSGKTHTLTSRTAWLLQHERFEPWNIIVATFTVKAAREMKERIGKLIGNGLESKLVLGTFHSISRRYLVKYGHMIGIKPNFGIADDSDTKAIISRIIKRQKLNLDPFAAKSRISRRKAKGGEADNAEKASKFVDQQEFERCYTEYQEILDQSNLLDYDDLLLRCVELLRTHPSCVSNIQAVLIDEFQDTNIVQFDLMRLFAQAKRRVTIVGDPDQSIYGWRSAETKNFKRMNKQYPDTVTIALEENYRSSGAILLTALEVIEQDSARIAKSLTATHGVGTKPVFRKLTTAASEAFWIVSEIRRCVALTGGMINHGDIAILLRSARLSRPIEAALGKAGISYRMVGGHRFFDRVEVKLLLDYMRVINQPDNNDAVARIVNNPSRRIGDSTIKALLEEAEKSSKSLWALIRANAMGNIKLTTTLSKQADQGLSAFVKLIRTAREKFIDSPETRGSPKELLEYILQKLSYEDHLERKHPEDHESRWANVEELINLASEYSQATAEDDEEALPEIEGLKQEDATTPISKFLANIALAAEVNKDADESETAAQVTISTMHAAKGLEWPWVFVPACYQGSIPHSRAEDTDEERRILYVAMTRAKVLLYMSCPMKNTGGEVTTLSPFLAAKSLGPYLDKRGPSMGASLVQSVSNILRRPLPSQTDISDAASTLQSVEDDLFPENPEEDEDGDLKRMRKERDWEIWDGTKHSFTQGQQAPKRQRLGDNGVWEPVRPSGQTVRTSIIHTTTMSESASFTVPSIGGFVSAGSHLQTISADSMNRDMGDSRKESGSNRAEAKKKVKAAPAKGKKQLEGQATIASFFGKKSAPVTKKPAEITPPFGLQNTFSRQSHSDLEAREPKLPPLPPPRRSIPIQNNGYSGGIPASLSTRRLGAKPHIMRPQRPFPMPDEEAISHNAYAFLNSDPAEDKASETVENYKQQEAAAGGDAESGCGASSSVMRPVQTMHNTSMAQVQQGAGVKRRLGMGGSLASWKSKSGTGFKPPSIVRRPEN